MKYEYCSTQTLGSIPDELDEAWSVNYKDPSTVPEETNGAGWEFVPPVQCIPMTDKDGNFTLNVATWRRPFVEPAANPRDALIAKINAVGRGVVARCAEEDGSILFAVNGKNDDDRWLWFDPESGKWSLSDEWFWLSPDGSGDPEKLLTDTILMALQP